MIRGGEFQTYEIIDEDDPMYELVFQNNDIQSLREALRSKTICISDRSAVHGYTILQVRISFFTGGLESHRKYNAKKPQTAVQHDYPALVKELLVHGADPHASNA